MSYWASPPPLDSKRLIEEFERALKLYRHRVGQAIAVFDLIRTIKIDDGPSSMYISVTMTELSPPGEHWDGTYTMTTK